jgi:hypothetical protein
MDFDSDEMFLKISCLEDAAQTRYNTTPATAAECLQQLEDELSAEGMEWDCVTMWQVLNEMKDDEEMWDTFSAEEQQGKDLPEGKQRKQVSTSNGWFSD